MARVVQVVKLTEEECRKALDYLKTIQNVIQVYAGEVDKSQVRVAVRELIQISHIIESVEQMLETAISERLHAELRLLEEGREAE